MRPSCWIATVLLGALLFVSGGGVLLAHQTNLTTGEVTLSGTEVRYRLTVSAHDMAVAVGIPTDLVTPLALEDVTGKREAIAHYVRERLLIEGDGKTCKVAEPEFDFTEFPLLFDLRLSYGCPAPPRILRINYLLFFDIDEQHRSLGQLITDAGEEPFLFDRSLTEVEFELAAPAPQLSPLLRFAHTFILGVEHILIGYDHILFLLALLIVNARLLNVIKVVTAFTLAHSLTLALAWYGILDLPPRLVESAIALSIAYVAVSNLFGRNFSHRWLLAGAFGLVHGLGFYGVLSDLGLAEAHVISTLLAFNLGVEVGQLLIVGLAFLPLTWWMRQPWYSTSAKAASATILAVAAWWVVERTLVI